VSNPKVNKNYPQIRGKAITHTTNVVFKIIHIWYFLSMRKYYIIIGFAIINSSKGIAQAQIFSNYLNSSIPDEVRKSGICIGFQ
jgi:hypothetical protein